jgi:hypothetical protein
MKNILPAPPIEITRTIKEKIFIISWTWFLLIFVYQSIFYGFIDELNQSGKINFGSEFSPYHLVWGNHIFPNILKIIIDAAIALLGGITVGYLLTRARITFKFFYSFFSAILQIFFFLFVMLLIFALIAKERIEGNMGMGLFYILESFRLEPFYATVLLIGLITIFFSYYFGINVGMRLKEENYFNTDTQTRTTFLDIKWYHWLWFWIPVGIYLKIILWIIFNSIIAVFEAIKKWKILEIFGIYTADRLKEPPRSIGDILWWGFLFAIAFFFQLKFIWDILTGRKKFKNKFVSFILVFLFSFITPFIIMLILYWLGHRK